MSLGASALAVPIDAQELQQLVRDLTRSRECACSLNSCISLAWSSSMTYFANTRLLESSLKRLGLRGTLSFSDSAQALDWLQHNPWNLLLLDLDMPAPNGLDILRSLVDRDRSACPIIIITALGDTASRRTGLNWAPMTI